MSMLVPCAVPPAPEAWASRNSPTTHGIPPASATADLGGDRDVEKMEYKLIPRGVRVGVVAARSVCWSLRGVLSFSLVWFAPTTADRLLDRAAESEETALV